MKERNLIATIPTMNNIAKVENIISNPYIYGTRWNTGAASPYGEIKTLKILKELSEKHNKKLWVDLKGRQLRVTEWASPMFECIKVNHNVSVKLPAVLILRGEPPLNITHAHGNKIFVDPLPRHCVGAGQSVNILGDDVEIDGYLTDRDKAYLECCRHMGINGIMASFVENVHDIAEIMSIHPKCSVVCKIESKKGIKCIPFLNGCSLMAARDDMYIETGKEPHAMYRALKSIIDTDKDAICASRIFSSLEHSDTPEFSDYQDLEMMYSMGYRNFMLCDNVCNYVFEKAVSAWRVFIGKRD